MKISKLIHNVTQYGNKILLTLFPSILTSSAWFLSNIYGLLPEKVYLISNTDIFIFTLFPTAFITALIYLKHFEYGTLQRYVLLTVILCAVAATAGGLRFVIYIQNPESYTVSETVLNSRKKEAITLLENKIKGGENNKKIIERLTNCLPIEIEKKCDNGCYTKYKLCNDTTLLARSTPDSRRKYKLARWEIQTSNKYIGVFNKRYKGSFPSDAGIRGNIKTPYLLDEIISNSYFRKSENLESNKAELKKLLATSKVEFIALNLSDFYLDSLCASISAKCLIIERSNTQLSVYFEILLGLQKFIFLGFMMNELLHRKTEKQV